MTDDRNPSAALIYITFPTLAEAESVGQQLVQRRLVACVNILPGMVSIYRWKDAVERAEEVVMIAKTPMSLADDVTSAVRALHSYETPAIVTVEARQVEPGYLAWIRDSTTG